MTEEITGSENKEEVLESISDIFMRYGIRSCSMDDIARYLKISKKTLYGMFENKNAVVEQVLQYRKSMGDLHMKNIDMGKIEPIPFMFDVLSEVVEKFTAQLPNNVYDIKKYHPESYRKHFQETDNHVIEVLVKYLNKGIEDGVFRKDIDTALNGYLISIQFMSLIDPESECKPTNYPIDIVIMTILENFIRSIATPKGVTQLEELIKKRDLNKN